MVSVDDSEVNPEESVSETQPSQNQAEEEVRTESGQSVLDFLEVRIYPLMIKERRKVRDMKKAEV